MKTLYEYATEQMKYSIEHYFDLVDKTNNFQTYNERIFEDKYTRQMILSGKSLSYEGLDPKQCMDAISRLHALNFDVEKGVSAYVYQNSRKYIEELIKIASNMSNSFNKIESNNIRDNPYLLPIWQAALNISSKSNLKSIFGSSSDQSISNPCSIRIAEYANDYFRRNNVSIDSIKERTERTLEGIVRDLVGRLLYESIVEDALIKANVPYKSESQYDGIEGVIYKFRADFVIPEENKPLAFIEVRKSSGRHASLYAKDKMFSAINWKGKYKNLLGIIVAEGEWTNESLVTMARVFDYVVPVSKSKELAENIKKYINGDKSILKWIIEFDIHKNN